MEYTLPEVLWFWLVCAFLIFHFCCCCINLAKVTFSANSLPLPFSAWFNSTRYPDVGGCGFGCGETHHILSHGTKQCRKNPGNRQPYWCVVGWWWGDERLCENVPRTSPFWLFRCFMYTCTCCVMQGICKMGYLLFILNYLITCVL